MHKGKATALFSLDHSKKYTDSSKWQQVSGLKGKSMYSPLAGPKQCAVDDSGFYFMLGHNSKAHARPIWQAGLH